MGFWNDVIVSREFGWRVRAPEYPSICKSSLDPPR